MSTMTLDTVAVAISQVTLVITGIWLLTVRLDHSSKYRTHYTRRFYIRSAPTLRKGYKRLSDNRLEVTLSTTKSTAGGTWALIAYIPELEVAPSCWKEYGFSPALAWKLLLRKGGKNYQDVDLDDLSLDSNFTPQLEMTRLGPYAPKSLIEEGREVLPILIADNWRTLTRLYLRKELSMNRISIVRASGKRGTGLLTMYEDNNKILRLKLRALSELPQPQAIIALELIDTASRNANSESISQTPPGHHAPSKIISRPTAIDFDGIMHTARTLSE